jgi:2-polyprenyl-3-methyl-5-hydroxy-6-metoxy-1,4-benzoquinol methylase
MKQLLKYHFFYNLYQNLIGCRGFLKRYVNIYIMPKITRDGMNVLDLGCGTANIVEFLPENINYTGIDSSSNYIFYDSKKYPAHTFICKNLKEDVSLDKKYDLIISEALISSLTDANTEVFFNTIKKHAAPDCKIVISDMNYSKTAHTFENFLFKSERGTNFRDREDYIKLLSKHFNIDNVSVISKIYRIPYSKLVFECSIKE